MQKIIYNEFMWHHRQAMEMIVDYLENNLANFTASKDSTQEEWQFWYVHQGSIVLYNANGVQVTMISNDADECFQTLNMESVARSADVSNELSHCYRE